MTTVLSALSLLVVHTATLSSPTVPAKGRQSVLLTLDAPGAIHLSAKSDSGTSCEVVDRVRGVFARAGSAGTTNCELDLLLDAGQYQVRFESSAKAKGDVRITAKAFEEINASIPRLTNGTAQTGALKLGQQATFWLSLKERAVPWVRIAGRHIGDVRLWKNGEWIEPGLPFHQLINPRPGQPMHEWWLDQVLEAGDYTVVLYGREPTQITGNSVDDSFVVQSGFLPSAPGRTVRFITDSSGTFITALPSQSLVLSLALDSPTVTPVELRTFGTNARSSGPSCRIDKTSVLPECAVFASLINSTPSFVTVRAPPGTRGTLEWPELRTDADQLGASHFGSNTTTFSFNANGPVLVGLRELPMQLDSTPLGCLLTSEEGAPNPQVLGSGGLVVTTETKVEREFNYDGSNAVVWFTVAESGSVLQRTGLTSRKFRVRTSGGLKSTCDVYALDRQANLKRLTKSKAEFTPCDEALSLDPGRYQLQLSGGLSGVEQLRIDPDGTASAPVSTSMGSCQLDPVTLNGRYSLIANDSGTFFRGLEVYTLPLASDRPRHLVLDSKRSLTFPIDFKSAVTITASGSGAFGCTTAGGKATIKSGSCDVSTGADTLTVSNPGNSPIALSFGSPTTPPAWTTPLAFAPVIAPLPRIAENTPGNFDFAREQTRAVAFDVATPGLYNVTTEGLLTTMCRLRTPVIGEVAQNQRGGRGRNCLVQTYLQKGRYLFTATAVGSSTGRAALVLSKRLVKELPGVSGEGGQYFRVEANELIQQKLQVKNEGAYELATTGQGIDALQCRLDDPEGWPIEAVPSPCSGARTLRPGTWVWTQMPITVESMRHTSLKKVREAQVLKGNKAHSVQFFTWYQAELGADGKDEFNFNLEGETQLDVVLTGGMQGRVFVLEKDKQPRAIEVVPPMAESEPAASSDEEDESQPEAREYSEEDEDQAPEEAPQAQAAPPPPSGVKITLPAGNYRLVTEHSRGDVGISYQLHLGSVTLLPGMTRSLPAPTTVPLFVPRDGTLRLRTEGDVDVRCRVLDEKGRVVLEGNENGADWNCALAEPIVKGRYTLVLESETQTAGESTVTVSLPPLEDKGALAATTQVQLGASVLSYAIPTADKEAVQDITASSKTPFSCALENSEGLVVHRKSRVTTCSMLVRPLLEKYRVRLWTTDGSAQVTLTTRTRNVTGGTSIGANDATAVTIDHAGRYRTGSQVFCIPSNETGLLKSCGLEVSLEKGPVIFVSAGSKGISVEETTASATDSALSFPLSRTPLIQNITASKRSVFLLEARVQHGERASPSCAFDGAGSVRERRDDSCFAASKAGTQATSRLWAPSESGIETKIIRRAVDFPEKAEALTPGRKHLSFSSAGRYSLPTNARARLEVTLSKDAWAVLTDDAGNALDLCAPTAQLRRCFLTGQGGSLVLLSPAGQADVTTVMLEGIPSAVAFTGLYEDSPRTPGTVRLSVPANDADRTVTIEGALSCTVALADGTRIASCRTKLPAKSAAELIIEHATQPLRAMVHTPGREKFARLGLELPVVPGTSLSSNVAVPLQAGRIDRTLVVSAESVVRVAAESVVCGLFRGNDLLSVDGVDTGCELVRVLSPGTYRLLVRPFANRVQPGTLRWSAEPVTQLTEGIGQESWLAPGEVRLYRFDTTNKGKLGLGIQSQSELLECAVYNDGYQLVGEGCQQYLGLDKGRYLLTVRNAPSPGATPLAFKPVLLGLSGETNDVPEDYLRDFFNRVGAR